MRWFKFAVTCLMLLGVTSGIGAWIHGNSVAGSVTWFVLWFLVLALLNSRR